MFQNLTLIMLFGKKKIKNGVEKKSKQKRELVKAPSFFVQIVLHWQVQNQHKCND